MIVKARGITVDRFDAVARGAGGEKCCRGADENDGEEAGSFEQGTSGVIGLLKHTARRKVAGVRKPCSYTDDARKMTTWGQPPSAVFVERSSTTFKDCSAMIAAQLLKKLREDFAQR